MADRETLNGILILGAGLAGLSTALAAAPRDVLVISPEPLMSGCSSAWAQGGMAAALSPDDDAERHARFVEMAREVGASEDPKDFDKAFKAVTPRPRHPGDA